MCTIHGFPQSGLDHVANDFVHVLQRHVGDTQLQGPGLMAHGSIELGDIQRDIQ